MDEFTDELLSLILSVLSTVDQPSNPQHLPLPELAILESEDRQLIEVSLSLLISLTLYN